jgi:hypothetical protein
MHPRASACLLRRTAMMSTAIMGVLLLLLGVAALVYHGITYTTRETVIALGPIQATHSCLPLGSWAEPFKNVSRRSRFR